MGPPIVGLSENIQRVKELVEHVAHTGLNTVIFGESGVGKEVIAQNLYQKSPRLGKPFIKINCAALPEGLLESELFGYERGAFTGAEQKRRGKFQLAHGGVLLLDEIGVHENPEGTSGFSYPASRTSAARRESDQRFSDAAFRAALAREARPTSNGCREDSPAKGQGLSRPSPGWGAGQPVARLPPSTNEAGAQPTVACYSSRTEAKRVRDCRRCTPHDGIITAQPARLLAPDSCGTTPSRAFPATSVGRSKFSGASRTRPTNERRFGGKGGVYAHHRT